jgi:hypothetical protein
MARQAPRVVKATIHMPATLWHQIRLRALDERTSATKLVVQAIEAWLKVRPPKSGKEERP